LSRHEKSFHQFTIAAHDHAGKSFEPLSGRDFRLAVKPLDHQDELFSGDLSLLNALQQVCIQRTR
jgi:hypothetical protein